MKKNQLIVSLSTLLFLSCTAKGGGDHIGPIIKAFVEIPEVISGFTSTIIAIGKTVVKARKIIASPGAMFAEYHVIDNELNREIERLEELLEQFKHNRIKAIIEDINTQCGGPLVAAMAIPNVGQAVSALCSKIGATDLKIESLFARAETILSNALSAKDHLTKKIEKIKATIENEQKLQALAKNENMQAAMQNAMVQQQNMPQMMQQPGMPQMMQQPAIFGG